MRQDKKEEKYDFPKIENSDAEASELPEKPLHVMVILFYNIFKKLEEVLRMIKI